MNGAFHGVITTAGPLGIRITRLWVPFELPDALLVGDREVGVAAVVARAAVDQARLQRAQQHRHVDALDRREPLDVGVDQVGEPVEVLGAARRRRGRPRPGTRPCAAATARSASALAAARDLAERLLVDRREVRERARARHALAADEVVGRDLDAGDGAHGRSPLLEGISADVDDRDAAVDGDHGTVQVRRASESSQATAPAISSGELGRRSGTSPSPPRRHPRGGAAPLGQPVHRAVRHRRAHPAGAEAVRAHARRPVSRPRCTASAS